MFALYPLLVFTQYVLDSSGSYNEYAFITGRVFLTLLLTLSVFIVPLNLFSYLNSKRNLDVYHALPIKRRDLFLSTFLSAIVVILIPYTLIYGIGTIYNVLVVADVDSFLLFKQYFYSVALSIAILLPILFAMMNTGTAIDGFIYSGLIHLLPAITYGTYILFGETMLLGFSPNADQMFLLFSTPIYTLFDLNFNIMRSYPSVWLIVGYWLLFSFVATWLVLYLYKIRKSEKAENPFTNKWFYPIFTTALIMVVQIFFYSVFSNFNNNVIIDARTLIFPVVFTFVAYMILDVIANRGFKHFLKGILNFVIISAVTLSLFYGLVITEGFGYVTNVPSASKVEEVRVEINDPTGMYGPSDYYSYNIFKSNDNSVAFNDESHISIITQIHQNILDEYEKNDYNPDSVYNTPTDKYTGRMDIGSITFEYEMNNGSTITRDYQVRIDWLEGLEQLFSTSQYFVLKYYVLDLILSDDYDVNVRKFLVGDALETNIKNTDTDLSADFAKAYRQDYLSKSWEELAYPSKILGFTQLEACLPTDNSNCSTLRFPVNEDDSNTLAFLQKNNKTIETSNVSNKTYIMAIPDAQSNEFFKNPRSFDYYPDFEISIIEINHQQAIELTPYLLHSKKTSENYHLLFVANNISSLFEHMNVQIYFIDNEAVEILSQIKDDGEIEKINLINLYEKLPIR